jgi:uncharacterized ion transporter superfamily protein YfcC
MSGGAAMVGSAFGPANPFQAGIALRLAELPPLSGAGLRLAMFAVGVILWIGWTMRHARRAAARDAATERGSPFRADGPNGIPRTLDPGEVRPAVEVPGEVFLSTRRHALILALVMAPMAAYVYGALRLGWGFNELSAAFIIGGVAAGLVGGLSLEGTVVAYLEGMQALLPSALMVGVARSISIVLEDGRVVDTILNAMVTPLAGVAPIVAAMLMVPVHALIHVAVPSVSGQAVLTMPLFVPMADVLGLSRQVPVLAYQTGAGLMELATPTNGSLMAILLAAGVSFQQWIRFALGGVLMLVVVGLVSLVVV